MWPPCSTVAQFLTVCEGEVAPLVLEGDQASVESYLRLRLLFHLYRRLSSHLTVVVIEGTEARESRRASSGSVCQAQDLQPPVGPDVGQAVVAVVSSGEHVEVESSLVWEEDLAEVDRDVGHPLDILVTVVVVQGNIITLLAGIPV